MLEKIHKYHVFDDIKLVIDYHQGDIFLEDLIQFKLLQLDDPVYCRDYNLIADMRRVNFKISGDDVEKYSRFLSSHTGIIGDMKYAILTETPLQTAFSILFKHQQEKHNHVVEIFNTVESALKWLRIEGFDATGYDKVIESFLVQCLPKEDKESAHPK